MSRHIDMSDLDALDDEELLYLHQRNLITDRQLAELTGGTEDEVGEALKLLAEPRPLSEVPHTGDANTSGLDQEGLERKLERLAKEQGVGEGDEDDEDEQLVYPPYTTNPEGGAASNDLLRAEISRRNEGRDEEDKLSLEGKKDDLITTLTEDDEDEDSEDEEQ